MLKGVENVIDAMICSIISDVFAVVAIVRINPIVKPAVRYLFERI